MAAVKAIFLAASGGSYDLHFDTSRAPGMKGKLIKDFDGLYVTLFHNPSSKGESNAWFPDVRGAAVLVVLHVETAKFLDYDKVMSRRDMMNTLLAFRRYRAHVACMKATDRYRGRIDHDREMTRYWGATWLDAGAIQDRVAALLDDEAEDESDLFRYTAAA